MSYTKEDVDRAYAAGVQTAEKLWQSYLLNMLDEGAITVKALECQKCGERYRFDPDATYPTQIVCPYCVKSSSNSIGLCTKVSRRVTISRQHVATMKSAVSLLLGPLHTFRELFRETGTPRTLTMQEVTQLDVYQQLMARADDLTNLVDSGWDSLRASKLIEPNGGPVVSAALERYDATKS